MKSKIKHEKEKPTLVGRATEVTVGSNLVVILVREIFFVDLNQLLVLRETTRCIAHAHPVGILARARLTPDTCHSRNEIHCVN